MSVSEKYSALHNRQKRFYLEHITRELPYRLTALDRLREGIKDNEQALADALHNDLGKSQFESYATEIGILLSEIRYMQSHLRDWVADRHVFSPLAFASDSCLSNLALSCSFVRPFVSSLCWASFRSYFT